MTAADKQGSRFSRNKLGKKSGGLLVLGFITVMIVGTGISQSSGVPAVSIGENGIQVNTGQFDVNGNDISDDGTTIWDASAGQIASSVVDFSAATASDVGLGNVENEAQVAEGGDTMTGDLVMDGVNLVIDGVGNIESAPGRWLRLYSDEKVVIEGAQDSTASRIVADSGEVVIEGDRGTTTSCTVTSPGDLSCDGLISSSEISPLGSENMALTGGGDNLGLEATESSSSFMNLVSNNGVDVVPNAATGLDNSCEFYLDSNQDASLSCPGTKDWQQDLDNGSTAYYTSQESPEVRAVYEGKAEVDGRTRINLPSHYSKTVSDSEPKLRATATVQGQLAYSAVIEKTDEYLVLDSSEPATVNYRITGVREGYEDKQVVR